MQSIPLFLFHIPDTDLYAFSSDAAGSNLPAVLDGRDWSFVEEIKGIRVEEYTDPPEFHEALSAVLERGYFIFHAEMVPLPAEDRPLGAELDLPPRAPRGKLRA